MPKRTRKQPSFFSMPTVTRTTWLYQSGSKSLHRLTLLAMECAPKLHFMILWAVRLPETVSALLSSSCNRRVRKIFQAER
jgi:hypothetical protein